MTPARKLLTAPAIAALIWASLAPNLSAQADVSWLCRVRWQEETYGGDTLATTGVFQLNRAAPQTDGSVVYMGQGQVDIVFTPGGGCTATRGGNTRMPMMVIISSDDGQMATVDISTSFMGMANPRQVGTFPVAVSCPYAQNSEMRVGVSSPPSLELPLQDGASASYDESSTHSYGQVGGQRGTVSLEYCRPEQN
jgi:hypothetical protein